jgi:hypothetical protein
LRLLFRIDPLLLPPHLLIADIVGGAVVSLAERHGPLVARLERKGAGLDEGEVMRLGRTALADEAGLRGHEPEVLFVAVTNRLRERQHPNIVVRGRRRFLRRRLWRRAVAARNARALLEPHPMLLQELLQQRDEVDAESRSGTIGSKTSAVCFMFLNSV